MPDYLSVLHVYHNSAHDVDAIAEADDIKLQIEANLLDAELREGVDVVETIPLGEDPQPSASVKTLRRARNILIRTGAKDAWDMARALDPMIYQFEKKMLNSDMPHGDYDWSNFMKVVKEVLDGNNPLDH